MKITLALFSTVLAILVPHASRATELKWHVARTYPFANASQMTLSWNYQTREIMFFAATGQLSRATYELGPLNKRPSTGTFDVPSGSQYPLGAYSGGDSQHIDLTNFETEFGGAGIWQGTQYYGQSGYQNPLFPHDSAHAAIYPIGVTMMGPQQTVLMTASTNGLDSVLYACDPYTGEGEVVALLSEPAFHPANQAAYAPSPIVPDALGRYWFAEPGLDRIAVFTPGPGVLPPPVGAIREFQLPAGSEPNDLVVAGGSIWFVEFGAASVGAINIGTGAITQYSIASTGAPNAESIFPMSDYVIFTLAGQTSAVGVLDTSSGSTMAVPVSGLTISVPQVLVYERNGAIDAYFIQADSVAAVGVPQSLQGSPLHARPALIPRRPARS